MAQQTALINKDDNKEEDIPPVVFVLDGTGSMGEFFNSMGGTIHQIICLLLLITKKVNIRLAVYHDYDGGSPRKNQGGYIVSKEGSTKEELEAFIATNIRRVAGGSDAPEAHKTAFNHLLNDLPSSSIIIHYTDAPPHMTDDRSVMAKAECKYLKDNQMTPNWLDLCATVRAAHRVTTITNTTMNVIMSLIGSPPESNETYHRTLEGFDFSVFIDEVCMGTMPDKSSKSIEPECQIDLSKKLKNYSPLTVLEAFEQLMTPECVMSLTTNPIFGKFWRLVCSKIKMEYPTRVATLCDRLSQLTNTLVEPNKTTLQEFVTESYNSMDEIREMLAPEWASMEKLENINKETNTEDTEQYVYIVDHKLPIVRKDLLELLRGGSSNFGDLIQLINNVEKRLVKISEMTQDQRDLVIPTTLAPMRLFSLIPHLLFPGTMFGKRGALIIAALSLRNVILAPDALKFLCENKGTWIDWTITDDKPEIPENWAMSFFNILKSLDATHMTPDEISFRDLALNISTFRKNMAGVIECKVGSIPEVSSLTPAYKDQCSFCNQVRDISLITKTKDGSLKCGLCCWNPPDKMAKVGGDPIDKTHMVRCRTCASHYSIERPNMFNCQAGKSLEPKCHYCREIDEFKRENKPTDHLVTPKVMCNVCIRDYVAPTGVDKPEEFVCRQCTEQPHSATTTIQIPITQLIKKNPLLKDLISMSHVDMLMDHIKFFTMLNTVKIRPVAIVEDKEKSTSTASTESTSTMSSMINTVKTIFTSASESATKEVLPMPTDQEREKIVTTLLHVGFHTIINSVEVIENMLQLLTKGDGRIDCPMCWDSKSVHEMSPACGNCDNRICTDCVSTWFSASSPGNVITQSHTCCMYCKKTPKFAIMRQHAKVLTQTRGLRTTKWEVGFHHGWCKGCNFIKPFVARECAEDTPDLHDDWNCTECKNQEGNKLLDQATDAPGTMTCPGCGIATYKEMGCDHITCTKCGDHWCYVCGEGGFEVDVWGDGGIYTHLDSEHGGIY